MEILLSRQTTDSLLKSGECTPTVFTTLAPNGARSRVAGASSHGLRCKPCLLYTSDAADDM
eukprot:1449772-Prymnesium_polylepis.1